MSRPLLIINPGSTSRKYAVAIGEEILFRASFEKTGGGASVTIASDGQSEERTYDSHRFDDTTDYVLQEAADRGILSEDTPLGAVALRIVAPGSYFQRDRLIDEDYVSRLEAAAKDAPLHIKPELHELVHVGDSMTDVPVYGISDSSFHATIPPHARTYAIAKADTEARSSTKRRMYWARSRHGWSSATWAAAPP
jgi:acetate kinase